MAWGCAVLFLIVSGRAEPVECGEPAVLSSVSWHGCTYSAMDADEPISWVNELQHVVEAVVAGVVGAPLPL